MRSSLLRASSAVTPEGLSHDQEVGYNIILRACRAPLTQIAANAGAEGSVVVNAIRNRNDGKYGYDAATDTYVDDMFKAGIVDPAKVTRTALQNAASIAGLLLTTEVVIADRPEKEAPPAGPGGMPGGDMGGMDF